MSQRWNSREHQHFRRRVRKRSLQRLRWNENQKSTFTAIKAEDTFRRVEIINSDNCLNRIKIRHLAGWRWLPHEPVRGRF